MRTPTDSIDGFGVGFDWLWVFWVPQISKRLERLGFGELMVVVVTSDWSKFLRFSKVKVLNDGSMNINYFFFDISIRIKYNIYLLVYEEK